MTPCALGGQNPPVRGTLVEEMRIGSVDGPQALTAVGSLVVSRDGRSIYVGQIDQVVRVFDTSSGRLIRTIGRRGAGPGEFNSVGSLGWKQDSLFVMDRVLRRLSLFSPDGDFFRTERIESDLLEATRSPALPIALTPDGSVIGEPQSSLGGIAMGGLRSLPIILMTREGKILRTLGERDVRGTATRTDVAGRIHLLSQPLSQRDLRDVAPDGSFLAIVHGPMPAANAGTFHVTLQRATGDTIYGRAYRYRPQPVPTEIADSIHDRYAAGFRNLGPAQAQELARRVAVLPPSLPPITQVTVDSDAGVWLRGFERIGGVAEWMVLDGDGQIRTIMSAPAGLRILAANREAVWGVIHDELGVPYVVRYRTATLPPDR